MTLVILSYIAAVFRLLYRCITSVVISSPFLLLITCNQFLLALEDLKRGTCRSRAAQTPTVNPSFLTQSVCGTLCPLMSASCHLTA